MKLDQRAATGRRCFHRLRCRRVGRHQISFEPGLRSDSLLSLGFVRTAVCVKPAPLTLRREKTADTIWRPGSTYQQAKTTETSEARRKSFLRTAVCVKPAPLTLRRENTADTIGRPGSTGRKTSEPKARRKSFWGSFVACIGPDSGSRTERTPGERRDLLQAGECARPTTNALKPLTNIRIQFGIPCCQLSLRQTQLKTGACRSNSINEQRSKGTPHVDGKN